MLNMTQATAGATTAGASTAQTVDAYAAQAAQRPLAGSGAGAFTRDGAWADSQVSEMAVALALPRIKPVIAAAITAGAKSGFVGAACTSILVDRTQLSTTQVSTTRLGIVQVDTDQAGTHNYIQMARQYPVIPGGVGPHPAREPVPV
jgi:hypothetical protein